MTSPTSPKPFSGQSATVALPPLTGPDVVSPAELALALVNARSVSGTEAPLQTQSRRP